jgi:hypothetical protein
MSRQPGASPFTLSRNSFGRLALVGADGTAHEGIVPVRAFGLTAPDYGIALMSTEGKELQWIENLDALPAEICSLIILELAQREFIPEIRSIVSVSSYATPSTWRVVTDRGATSLILKSEDDIRRLRAPGALMIADSQGIHFRIRDRLALDAHSQKILKRFL